MTPAGASETTLGAAIDAALDALVLDLAEQVADMLADRVGSAAPSRSPWFTVGEAADYLRCSKKRVYDLTSQSRLPAHKDGSRTLLHRDELDAYLSGAADTVLTPPGDLASQSRSRRGARIVNPGVKGVA
jgi:excisionase family DNA binding protein